MTQGSTGDPRSSEAMQPGLLDCLGLIGSKARAMKMGIGNCGLEDKGPRLKAKSKSLKLASHTRKKKVGKERWTMEIGSGRMKKRVMMGRGESNLGMRGEIREGIK
ncbi:hypothetical protein L1987_08035 [Smallanthus sonchifolius]|uniref:Uncharacterized protein n=1 Tax=Smallanthus sonchifolius TaxID=185202 RepID=A0ACB9JK21_9ASTR|nr:hypothetical protein L1987_08035 [Smallanthus sonchifolius]